MSLTFAGTALPLVPAYKAVWLTLVRHRDFLADSPPGFVAFDAAVEGVAFDRFAACFLDDLADGFDAEDFGGFGSGVVINKFVADGAVDVVGSVGERNLGRADAEHNPIGFDVGYVVEHQAADRHRAQIHGCRRLGDVAEAGVFGMKR